MRDGFILRPSSRSGKPGPLGRVDGLADRCLCTCGQSRCRIDSFSNLVETQKDPG